MSLARKQIDRSLRSGLAWSSIVLAGLALAGAPQLAHALIVGGEGNAPVHDPGWPKGAADVFNTEARVAWWEGPPFGGGEWHGECRGDAASFNKVLTAFAAIDAPRKQLVVHDGISHSFWLNPNGEPAKQDAAKVDWVFVVWQPDRWDRLRRLPADIRPGGDDRPVPRIDVYTGGNIVWTDVNVPEGIDVEDERLEAHGFTPADGTVLEGTVVALATQKPLQAHVRLAAMSSQEGGGYEYKPLTTVQADDQGRWVIKNVPEGSHRIVVEAEGYLPRVIAYAQHDGQPRWFAHHTGLAKVATVAGRVLDPDGKPLADVDVRLADVVAEPGGRYETTGEYRMTTGADGRFQFDQAPVGKANVWVHKSGWCRPGLGLPIEMPVQDVELTMKPAATLLITVDFDGADLEGGYALRVVPEEGQAAGRWSASGSLDANFSARYENIPPGKYVVTGRPNPGSDDQETEPVTVELVGGESTEVILKAK